MHDLQSKLTAIKEQVIHKVSYPFLIEYVNVPEIDDDKLLLLVSVMDQLNFSYEKVENYALTAMLIQIALDTHDQVQNTVVLENDPRLKNRQLTVLAGDYYSGLYYKLLAETNDIGMIQALAAGIKEVNEHKITIYKETPDAIDKFINSIKRVESSLFEKLTEYVHATVWDDFISNFLLFKRLLLEKKRYNQAESSVLFDGLKNIVFPKLDEAYDELSIEQKNYLIFICDKYIDYSRELVEKGLNKLPPLNDLLRNRIMTILTQQQLAKTCVEEG